MIEFNIDVAKGKAKLTFTTDDYVVFGKMLERLTEITDKRASYTTARPVSEEEKNLLSQLIEEQNRLCECRTELAKAKGYLSELLKVLPYVNYCDSCSLHKATDGECNTRTNLLKGRCFKHNLQDEIEAFLEGEKKDECGNV